MTHEPDGAPRLRADDPATLPAPGPQDGQWKGLDPRYIRVRVISEVIGYLIFAAAVGWPLVLKLVGVWGEASWWAVLPWPLGVAVLCLVQVLLTPRRVRSYGYREDADDFMVRKGLLVRTLVVVPYGRMQYVDVSSGPILRMFGLSSITLHTASAETDAELPGITAEEARRLRGNGGRGLRLHRVGNDLARLGSGAGRGLRPGRTCPQGRDTARRDHERQKARRRGQGRAGDSGR